MDFFIIAPPPISQGPFTNRPPNCTIVPHCHCEERSDVAISWNVLSKYTVGGDVLDTLKNSSH